MCVCVCVKACNLREPSNRSHPICSWLLLLYVYTHTCIKTYLYAYIFVYKNIYMWQQSVCSRLCSRLCSCMYIHMCMYIHIYISRHIYMHIYLYTHIYMRQKSEWSRLCSWLKHLVYSLLDYTWPYALHIYICGSRASVADWYIRSAATRIYLYVSTATCIYLLRMLIWFNALLTAAIHIPLTICSTNRYVLQIDTICCRIYLFVERMVK